MPNPSEHERQLPDAPLNAVPPDMVTDFTLVAVRDPLVHACLQSYLAGEVNSTTMLVMAIVGLHGRCVELRRMLVDVMSAKVEPNRGPSPLGAGSSLREAYEKWR